MKRRPWKLHDDKYLIENYEHTPCQELARKLNRTEQAIKLRAFYLRVTKPRRKITATKEQLEHMYHTQRMTFQEIANKFNVTKQAVWERMKNLGCLANNSQT